MRQSTGRDERLSLLGLPRETRDRILYHVFNEVCDRKDRQYLGLHGPGSQSRYLMGNQEVLSHPVRLVNHQIYEESNKAVRDLLADAQFRLGSFADGYMVYLVLRDMSPTLCSLIRNFELGEDVFQNWGNGEINNAFWDDTKTCRYGNMGDIILDKLVNLRAVKICTPRRHCIYGIEGHGPNDECTAKRYNTMSHCTNFFAGQLGGGRIDALQLKVEREAPDLTSDREVKADDPVYVYMAATEHPWDGLERLARIEDIAEVDRGAEYDRHHPLDDMGPRFSEAKRIWHLTFTRKAQASL